MNEVCIPQFSIVEVKLTSQQVRDIKKKIDEQLSFIRKHQQALSKKLAELRQMCPHNTAMGWKHDWHCDDCGLERTI